MKYFDVSGALVSFMHKKLFDVFGKYRYKGIAKIDRNTGIITTKDGSKYQFKLEKL